MNLFLGFQIDTEGSDKVLWMCVINCPAGLEELTKYSCSSFYIKAGWWECSGEKKKKFD